jgi:putative heme iron utilization protein
MESVETKGNSSASGEVRLVLNRNYYGVLSTHSREMEGYPFGSVVPYCIGPEGYPVILVSKLAQHTQNVLADPRASLMIMERGQGNIQAQARITLMCHVLAVAEPAINDLAARYYAFFPEAEGYHTQLDFGFFRVDVKRVRYIGGFGKIRWLETDKTFVANPFYGDAERSIVVHMNEDHGDALVKYCQDAGFEVPDGETPRMVGADSEGFHLRLGGQLVRVRFDSPVETLGQIRAKLVDMARC